MFAAALGAAIFMPAAAVADENYPHRVITMVVPFPAGGTTDILARIVGQSLARQLGQNVIIENRAGAGGNIGSGHAANAEPDGYTLLMGTVGTHAINASLYTNMPFDHVADFAPLSRVAMVPNLVVANPEQPFATVGELVEHARENPDDVFYASSGNGTSIHLSAELFKAQAGIDMEHVPYSGSAQALTGLMGNEVAVMFDNFPSAVQHVRTGALVPLAVTSNTRSAALPDVPTVAEAGYPDYEASSWFGLFAPAGTPEPILEKLNAAIVQTLNDPEIEAQFEEQGALPHPETPEEFAAFIESETAKWGEVVKASGASVD
ncbi:tripartite tricarboxylate transporter substrate binding protein [Aquamicrobium sp. LC103]|nr:tripartite tricarboxylate transporter substrate binding protein [Aquamicrobium sp. LC103]